MVVALSKAEVLLLLLLFTVLLPGCQEEVKKAIWKQVPVVDEFGDEVENKFVVYRIFKGQVTTNTLKNDDVEVHCRVLGNGAILFSFTESGSNLRQFPNLETVDIRFKRENGSSDFFKGFTRNNEIVDPEGELLWQAFSQEVPLKVLVDVSRIMNQQKLAFNFEFDTTGLKPLLSEEALTLLPNKVL